MIVERSQAALKLLPLIVALPSTALAFVSVWIGQAPAILNLDLIVAYAVVVVLMRHAPAAAVPIGVALVTGICAVAVLRSVGFVYVADPALIVGYLRFIEQWPWRAFMAPVTVAALAVAAFAWLRSKACKTNTRARLSSAATLLALVLGLDVVSGAADSEPAGSAPTSTSRRAARISCRRWGGSGTNGQLPGRFLCEPEHAERCACADPSTVADSIGQRRVLRMASAGRSQ